MARKRGGATTKAAPGGQGERVELAYIAEALRALAVPIDELHPDPANARKHSPENLAAIRGSLAKFGQRMPIVVQRQGMIVRAGNGRLTAARQLGWTHLACVVVDEGDVEATAYAISDNRTAELAEWDDDALRNLLQSLGDESFDDDLDSMLKGLADERELFADDAGEDLPGDQTAEIRDSWQVIVDCSDEAQQSALLERLQQEGYECRALIS